MPTDAISARIIAAFQDKATGALDSLLAEDVELRPPTYGKSWRGRGLVAPLLGLAAASFDRLSYTDVVADGDILILRFEAEVEGQTMSGVDWVRLNDQGLISVFEIFSRPPKVALLFLERMTARIKEHPDIAAMMRGPAPGDAT